MVYTEDELREAKRQIDSTIHKIYKTLETLKSKTEVSRYKSQITLAERRLKAFGLASKLIEREMLESK